MNLKIVEMSQGKDYIVVSDEKSNTFCIAYGLLTKFDLKENSIRIGTKLKIDIAIDSCCASWELYLYNNGRDESFNSFKFCPYCGLKK